MVDREKMENYFYLGIFLIAMLFALISVFGLYSAISRLISNWFNYRYQPIFDALFNLAILAISIYLIRERMIKK
ncbi:MAG: hypothetical protein PHU34_06660 [Candidatus Methanoperedens sp.]|nr:hypothetical protein [Candidatus Methanoperedens sp.]